MAAGKTMVDSRVNGMRGSPGRRGFSGFKTLEAENVLLYVSERYLGPSLQRDLLDLPRILDELEGRSSRLSGTDTLWEWQPDGVKGGGLIVRQFVHGGLWGKVAGDLFLGRERMTEELRVHLHARTQGVPTCEPVALRTERSWGPFTRGYLVTKKLPETCNLKVLCERAQEGLTASPQQKRALIGRLVRAIAAMHDAGILHADLNVKNLLVKDYPQDPRVFIIDFDKACIQESVPLEKRLRNLVRLDRSVMKWPATRNVIDLSDRLRLWREYLTQYPEWADRWKEFAGSYSTSHALHFMSRKSRKEEQPETS